MPSGRKPEGESPLSNAERQARCHVRFQGVRTQNSSRCFSSRLNFSDAGVHGGGRALSDG
jgi:hypothetical protein